MAFLFIASPFIVVALIVALAITLGHRENMAKIKMGIDPDASPGEDED